jgi:hypothetical protein
MMTLQELETERDRLRAEKARVQSELNTVLDQIEALRPQKAYRVMMIDPYGTAVDVAKGDDLDKLMSDVEWWSEESPAGPHTETYEIIENATDNVVQTFDRGSWE